MHRKLGVISNGFRATIKIIFHITLVIIFLFVSFIGHFLIWNRHLRRRFHAVNVSFFCKLILKVINVKLVVHGRPKNKRNYFLVGNHTGLLDIYVIASNWPSLFITSNEMKETPGLGTVVEMGGCLFVERRDRSKIHHEMLEIREVLRRGLNVVLFPEAASYNGEHVHPFKKTLMTAAAGIDVPILPLVINVKKINHESMSNKWRDSVFWYDDHPFLPLMWKMHKLKSIEIELLYLEPIICHSEDERHHVAQAAHSQIEKKFVPII